MDWIADGIAAAAFVVAALTYLDGRRNTATSAQSAVESAREAARATAAAERMAVAAEAANRRPPWRLTASGDVNTYVLENLLDHTAYGVTVGPAEHQYFRLEHAPQDALIEFGGRVTFVAYVGALPGPTVVVKWADGQGQPVHSWSHALVPNSY
jgi:hypothetical protein